jgi:hypothetical protein
MHALHQMIPSEQICSQNNHPGLAIRGQLFLELPAPQATLYTESTPKALLILWNGF